jgi:glycosyltransferase involved in cell wall biosynthesis
MRVALNCRSILLNQRTGIGRYTYHLLDSLGQIDQGDQYLLHAPKGLFSFRRRLPDFPDYKNFIPHADYFNRGVGVCDIYHYPCPDAVHPWGKAKIIVTVHDLIYKAWPQGQTPHCRELTEKHMQKIVTGADMVICISENTRRDLLFYLNVPLEKTCVVYNGVDHGMFYVLSAQQRLEAAGRLRELGIHGPYVLYVGTIEPRKNLAGLLESFAWLKSRKLFEGSLVVAGMKGWMSEGIGALMKRLNIQNEVIFTGFIEDGQLRDLYNLTELFVFPSFYEGFGFPVLEAFCCGAPVVCSQTSSCRELADGAAVGIDPVDVKAMGDAMARVLSQKSLQTSLGQAGQKRSKEFSFLATARHTLNVYEKIMA